MNNTAKADWLRSEIKKWFEINYLDGDEVQDGQMLASSECLDALIEYHMNFLRSEIEKLDNMLRDPSDYLDPRNVTQYNSPINSIITRYKEELKELESK